MQDNVNESSFYSLTSSISKRFEKNMESSIIMELLSLEKKKLINKILYNTHKKEPVKIIPGWYSKCPESLTNNQAIDGVHIMVDNISSTVFHDIMVFTSDFANNASRQKKKLLQVKAQIKRWGLHNDWLRKVLFYTEKSTSFTCT